MFGCMSSCYVSINVPEESKVYRKINKNAHAKIFYFSILSGVRGGVQLVPDVVGLYSVLIYILKSLGLQYYWLERAILIFLFSF